MSSGEPRRLLELTSSCMCRWPVDGVGAETLFCAEAIEPGSPYCAAHRKMSGAPVRTAAEVAKFTRSVESLAYGRAKSVAGGAWA